VWIGPPTDETVKRAAVDGKAILVSPIAFVSEHIETLVELDEDYAHVARAAGAKIYLRAPALGAETGFIETLADLTIAALGDPDSSPRSHCGRRICPANWRDCPNRRPAASTV
jgi:ferrochelatase